MYQMGVSSKACRQQFVQNVHHFGPWIVPLLAVGFLISGDSAFTALGIGPATSYLPAVILASMSIVALFLLRFHWPSARVRRAELAMLVLMTLLGIVLTSSLIYGTGGAYGITKVFSYWGFAWLGGILGAMIAGKKEGVPRLAWAFLLCGLALGMVGIVTVFAGVAERQLAVLGGGPNVFVRLMAFGMLSAGVVFSLPSLRRGVQWAALASGALLSVPLILSGSRGGVLAAFVASAVALLAPARSSKAIWRAKLGLGFLLIVCLAVFAVARYTSVADSISSSGTRLSHLTSDLPGSTSVAGRWEAIDAAWDMFLRSPIIGHGVGAFSVEGAYDYPHNIELELLSETGIVGFGLFAAMCLVAGRLLWRLIRSSDPALQLGGLWLLAMASMIGVAAQASGDLYASRYLFFFFGAIAGLSSTVPRPERLLEAHRDD